jgi:hypothetical protein
MNRKLLGGDGPWEYTDRAGVLDWAQNHVALAIAAAALIWFSVVYVLTLTIDLFT